MAKQQFYILPLLWLALLSSPLLHAATCPQDSLIGYSENGTPISKILYQYDEAGRVLVSETWKINADSVLIGTTKNTTEYYPNGKIKSYATWIWSTTIDPNGWIGKERNDYVYDAQGNTILWSIYTWDNTTNNWTNKNQYEYQYENKKQILYITYTGSGNQWIPKTKQENQYDAKGNTVLDRYYSSYDATNSKWIGSHWYENQYNAANQLLLSKKYSWDTANGDWKGETQTEYGYNAAGKQTLYIYYTWDATTSTFVGSSKNIYDYDQWNNTVLQEQYKWQNNQWQGTGKVRYEFTAYNSDPIMIATFQWNTDLTVFIGVDSIRTASDEADNQILDERYTYNVTNQAWVGTLKEEKIYDDAKNIISKKTYQWQSTQWIYATKDSSAYDANKNKILEEHYTWNTSESYWVGTGEKHVSEYTNNMETLQEVYIWNTEGKDWTYKSKIIKEFDGKKMTLDEEYALTGGVLVGTKKEKFAYNDKGETVMKVTYSWLHDDVWQGQDSILAKYDNNQQKTLNETYKWMTEDAYWKGDEKATYTFNKNKQQTSSWVYNWDDTNRQWIFNTRDSASFDAAKNQTLKESYTYDVAGQAWQGTTKWEAAFDAAKNQTMDAQYEWDMTNQAWVGISKKEYGFNADKQQVMFATYKWQGGAWVGTQKEERELDDEGREILVASYKWGSSTWVGKSRVVTTYYKDKLIASLANYDWKSNKWVGKDSTLYTYNAADLQTSKIIMLYQSSAWVNSTKLEQAYNAANVLSAKYNFSWLNNDWQPIDKWEAHFDMAGRMDLDSTMVYKNNTWIYKNKNTNTYDSQNRLTLIMTENWVDGEPSTGSRTENEYGDYGLIHTLTSEMQGGTWVALTQKNNTYNTDGNLTETLDQKNTESGWQTTHLYQATYDGDKPTMTMDQQYAEGAPVSGTRIAYEYTSTENIETTSIWENKAWVEQTRIGYYQSGNLSIETHYIHDGTQWIGDTKVETTKIGKNKEVATYQWQTDWVGITKAGTYYDEYEDETSATWNWKNNIWVCDTKKGESYYATGKLKSQTSYKIVSNAFVFSSRVEYEYGTGDKDKTTATYTYNMTNQAWVGVSKSGVTYSGSNKTSETSYTWIIGFTWQPNQKKEYEYSSNPKDLTTATYSWDNTIPDWVGISKSGKTYASTGKQASDFSYTWGTTAAGNADWLPVAKTEWEYGSGKDNAIATYKGVDTAWVGISKYAEQYTEHGDSLGFYTNCWKNDTWSDSLKREFTYNEYGDIILYIDASWSGSSWTNKATSTKWEVEYYDHDKGLTTLNAHYYWKTNKNTWYGTGTKLENSYDENGEKILEMKSTWKGSSWNYSSKQEWAFDEYGYTILSVYWNRDGNKWKGSSKFEYRYLEDKTQIMYASYKFNTNTKIWDWDGISKSETIYDENKVKIGEISYKWSSTLRDWIGMFKYEYIYDDQNRLIEQSTSRYSETSGWYLDTKTIKEYDSKHGNIATYVYDGEMQPISITKQMYDDDTNNKLRIDLYAVWSGVNLQTYAEKTYYYACDPKFTITVNTKEEGIGEVSGGGIYTYYARPQISAIETPNCNIFNQWTDGETSDKRRILVIEDKTYTAEFTSIEHTITTTVKDNRGGSAIISK